MLDTDALHSVVGWDIGGAHVKACVLQGGEVVDVAQWACPLWQGMAQLGNALDAARQRWPQLGAMQHAVTMTGEMVDLFAHREDGVQRIAQALETALANALPASAHAKAGRSVRFYAGDAGWCTGADVAANWEQIASANWLATARHAAFVLGYGAAEGVLIDIGSTTTDLIAFRAGRVLTRSRTDAERLAHGELVYQGVVRTPLCALAQRIDWRGTPHNVMNEFFATTADVYRLTDELNPSHDLHPSADNAAKDLPATRRRLARMVGLDARDGSAAAWAAFARSWRDAQVTELAGQLRRVIEAHSLGEEAIVVSAGCGDFLVSDVLARAGVRGDAPSGADADAGADADSLSGADPAIASGAPRHLAVYGSEVARVSARASGGRSPTEAWAQVCAPSVAVAALFDRDHR